MSPARATPSPHEDKWRQTTNRGHNSTPVIRSRAGPGGADRVDNHHVFASEQSAQREPTTPSSISSRRSHKTSNILQRVGVSCHRIWTCHTLPCPCLKERCCVSKLPQLYTPLSQALMCPAQSFGSDARMTHTARARQGEEVVHALGSWRSTPQCLPRSKTKTPNSALFPIHPSFFFSGLYLFISFWSFLPRGEANCL